MSSQRILVVDDEKPELDAWAKALRYEGYSVWKAQSPDQALQLCNEHPFDLVMLDFLMPAMDGVELLRRIRKRLPHIRSVVVSGKIDEKVRASEISDFLREAVEADRYLHKPVSNEEIKGCIAELLTSTPAQKSWQDIAKRAQEARTATIQSAKQASKKLKKLVKKRKR